MDLAHICTHISILIPLKSLRVFVRVTDKKTELDTHDEAKHPRPIRTETNLPLGAAMSHDTIYSELNMEAYDKWRIARRDLRASIELPGGGDFDLPETTAAQRH